MHLYLKIGIVVLHMELSLVKLGSILMQVQDRAHYNVQPNIIVQEMGQL